MLKRAFYIIAIFSFAGLHACSQSKPQTTRMVGSTPADSFMKAMLLIPNETVIDFVKWDLQLTPGAKKDKGDFTLHINFGQGKPNTSDHIGGGERKTYKGTYSYFGKLCALKSPDLYTRVTLIQLNENLMHLTESDLTLKKGNAGWSYTLNIDAPSASVAELPATRDHELLKSDTATRIVFEGRTPCQPLAKDFSLPVSNGCFKLKWQLILNRDPVTLEPATYVIWRTDSRQKEISGTWKLIQKNVGGDQALIVQLQSSHPENSMSFFMGDRNVLFVLDKEQKLYTGNDLFSYTLNRRE